MIRKSNWLLVIILTIFLLFFSQARIVLAGYCGDDHCGTNEDCESCPDDCNTCPSEPPPSPGSNDTVLCYSGTCPPGTEREGKNYEVWCSYPGCGERGDCCTASNRNCWMVPYYGCGEQQECQIVNGQIVGCDDVMNPVHCINSPPPGCLCFDKCGNVQPVSHATISCVDGVCVYNCYYCDLDQGGTNQPPSVESVTPDSGCSRREKVTFETTYYDANGAGDIVRVYFAIAPGESSEEAYCQDFEDSLVNYIAGVYWPGSGSWAVAADSSADCPWNYDGGNATGTAFIT